MNNLDLLNAIAEEQSKLQRQIDLKNQTKVKMEILGETAKELNKLNRQEAAIKVTRSNIAKLQKAAGD